MLSRVWFGFYKVKNQIINKVKNNNNVASLVNKIKILKIENNNQMTTWKIVELSKKVRGFDLVYIYILQNKINRKFSIINL